MAIKILPSGGFIYRINVRSAEQEARQEAQKKQKGEEQQRLDQEMVEMICSTLPVWQDG